ncbi:hypothetical protein AAFF_G00135270 [Aldrovandia affinis]|uniref:HECT domain-containing protein n=1 Tax=Aldrovandia affinis TaxID=143900 RepID=A0AAD7RSL4_9TELE|nr:hypothetical protein AAFF_G00135270 [Aldrovandia affinis]
MFCWGDGSSEQLGEKNRDTKLPAEVEGLGAVAGVACGRDHCLALCTSGQVYSWGSGAEGQLGTGACPTKNQKPRRVQVPSPIPILIFQVACGNVHSLALTAGGDVLSWGQNSHGQLGLAKAVPNHSVPTPVLSLTGTPVTQVCAGGAHSLFLSLSGLVYCCGANEAGQLGLNRIDKRGRFNVCAVPALRPLDVSYISCGEVHTAILTKDGSVFTFGEGRFGQLGHNSTANELKPRRVENIDDRASQIACGSHHTLVLVSSGALLAFGSGAKGQLGQGNTESCPQPTVVQHTWSNADLTAQNMKIHCGWNSNFIHVVPPESFEAKSQMCKLDEERLRKWRSLKTSNKDAEREITSIFSSSSSLVTSFIQNGEPVDVDMNTVRETFIQLKKIPWVTNLIPMVPLIQTLVIASPVMKSVDIFLILPECHLLHEDQNVISIVLPLAGAILRLSDASIKCLRERWSSLDACSMKNHILMWKHALSFLLRAGLLMACDGNVKDVLQILKHIYKANKKADEKVPVEEFYINEICPSPFLQQDLGLWRISRQMQDQEYPAIFCRFPFVLNLQSKIFVFHFDAAVRKNIHVIETWSQFVGVLPASPLDHPTCPVFHLHVKRTALIDDTFRKLGVADHEDFRKDLIVHFQDDLNESMVNKRDFFLHLFDELLSPDSGMFMYNDSETLAWFPSHPGGQLNRYFLFGVLCGMAMYNINMVHLPFPLALFKKLLDVKPSLEDVKEFSPVLGKSLQYLLDYPDDDVGNMDMTFSVNWNGREVELDPSENGKLVTNANRERFVQAYVDHILDKSVEDMFKEFKRGFYKVCDMDVVQFFQPEELRGVVVGIEDYDWDTLRENAVYEGEYHPQHSNIIMFWEVFEDLSPEQKKGFLLFLTGCNRVPIVGMSHIKMRVTVLPNSSPQHFPETLTCHTLLLLPVYQAKERLRDKLIEAIGHNRGFWKD